jgi:hypothetical protein
MYLFFKPLQLGIPNTNNPVEFVYLGLDSSRGCATTVLPLVDEHVRRGLLEGIPPLLDLRWINLIFRGYLVNGFVASQGGKGDPSLLLGRELSSHDEDLL